MSFPKYPEYKDSGVEWIGDIPAHWITAPIKNLADVINGYPFDSRLFSPTGQHPLVRIRDLNKIETAANYDGEFLKSAAITSEDVLIGMDGEFNVGRWNGQGKGLLNQRMCCVRGHKDITSRLIEYALPFPLKAINDITYSTTVKHLSSYQVQKTFIALPPHEQEQSAIAAFLDRETAKIDALVAEQEKLIELLKEKRQAVISHAVAKGLDPNVPMKDSGVEWLGEVPEHWELTQLKYVVALGSVITYGIVQAGPHVEDGVPYIKTSDMSGDSLPLDGYSKSSFEIDKSYSRSKVSPGDIVVAIRATVGKCLLVPEDLDGANLTQGTAKVSSGSSMLNLFLLHQMNSLSAQTYFDLMAKGATFREITLDALRRTPITVPPLDEQKQIIIFLEGKLCLFDDLQREAQSTIDLLKERRSALISAAVTGKIDVRGLADATQ